MYKPLVLLFVSLCLSLCLFPCILFVAPLQAQDPVQEEGVALAEESVFGGLEEGEAAINATILIGEPLGAPLSGLELDEITDEVTNVMRCPVCQGLSVGDSPSKSARAMKAEAKELLAAGYSGEQVMNYFEQAYGEFVRLEPKAEGFNLVVWFAPAVGFLLGAVALMLYLRRNLATDEVEEFADEEEDPEMAAYRERVRAESSQEEVSS